MKKLNGLRQKLRVGVSDQHAHKELWHMFISPLKLIGVSVGTLAVFFIVILTLAAYTPLLNLIPGYSGSKQREEMIRNIMRVDSIERRLGDIEAWGYDVSLIMEGRTPVVHDVISSADDTARVVRQETVVRNAEDSLLRGQMEGDGPYNLRQGVAEANAMQPPVKGEVEAHFDPRGRMFGVRVATGIAQQVLAAGDGTVIASYAATGAGYTVQVQHADNLISIYSHLSHSLVGPGTRVRRGEVLGGVDEGGLVEVELWRNGNPVNPENYMVF